MMMAASPTTSRPHRRLVISILHSRAAPHTANLDEKSGVNVPRQTTIDSMPTVKYVFLDDSRGIRKAGLKRSIPPYVYCLRHDRVPCLLELAGIKMGAGNEYGERMRLRSPGQISD
ncbi:hypothetical protein NITHO_1690004 [Nitrolancea hollandica Lb]|uniref:Uncharacterized protein n=1 Tax=Nitrolancea hollandica Lb TaxID=1129897 RepID=I4EE22_9BACT|nr:hypothetical protein NITHO_1690004 [Nitrolancea hollandica Lb]